MPLFAEYPRGKWGAKEKGPERGHPNPTTLFILPAGNEPSLTSTISATTLPCASRWTASATSALGASNRHQTSPFTR